MNAKTSTHTLSFSMTGIPRRVLFAIVVAVGLNLVVFWSAIVAIGPLSFTPPGAVDPISITVINIIFALVIPMGVVGTIVWLVARHRPATRTWAAWAGLSFGVLSAALLFTMGEDLRTTAVLAAFHVIAGIAWFVCLTARRSRA